MSDHANTPPFGIASAATRQELATVEQRLHDRIAGVRNVVTELRVSAAEAKGERKSQAKDIGELMALKTKINGLVWKVAAAAIGGGAGMPVILSQLGVI